MRIPIIFRRFLKEREMLHFYKQFINKNDLCFDAGANIGERTDIFLKLGANVVSIEPQSSCVDILMKKYRNRKRVNIQKLALGSKQGSGKLMICDETNECTTLSEDFMSMCSRKSGFHWQKSEIIHVTTLDELIKQFGKPKLLKMDVEGYESEVFKGLTTYIQFICFEFNYPLLRDTIKSLEILSSLGNFYCNFIKYEMMKLVLPEWIPIDAFKTSLFEIISPDILTGEIVVKCMNNE